MNHSVKVGFSFGLTSGIITTLGLMVGLEAGTNSKLAVIGGILTIAIADAFSDSLGIHISEESEGKHTRKEIWQSTVSTFIAKLCFALTFLIPVLLLSLTTAIYVSIAWGLLAISIFSYSLAKGQKSKPIDVVSEHLFITILVVVTTHFLGTVISSVFG